MFFSSWIKKLVNFDNNWGQVLLLHVALYILRWLGQCYARDLPESCLGR